MTPEPLVLRPQGRRLWWTLGVCAAVGIGGVAFLLFGSGVEDRVYGALMAAIGGGITAGGIWRLRRGDTIRIDTDGLHHPDMGVIPWEEVVDVRPATVGYSKGLTIDVRDPEPFRRRNRRLFRALGRADEAFGMPLLHLPALLLPAPPEEVMQRMEELAGRPLDADAYETEDAAPARPL